MEIYKTISMPKLQELLDHMRGEVAEWRAVDVTLEAGDMAETVQAAGHLDRSFSHHAGSIFVCGPRKMLMLARLGQKAAPGSVRESVNRALPKYACRVSAATVTKEGLETIKITLKDMTEPLSAPDPFFLLKQKRARWEKIFFVVDDDLFMRSLLVKALRPYGKVIEFGDGADLADAYMRDLPDVVFLDIHLPCGSGMDIMNQIMNRDGTAGIVILSADSVKDNVLLAQARGARAFLAKPFTKEKIEEAMKKCIDQAELLLRQP
jgi:two-component system chemotaxis response regulator CheY